MPRRAKVPASTPANNGSAFNAPGVNLLPIGPAPAGGGGGGPAPQAPAAPKPQPVRAPTGLPYGEAGQLQQAQQAQPLQQDPMEALIQRAQGMPFAPVAGGGGLTAPTQRPNEPVTSGLPSGPGPGPEALQGAPPSPTISQTYRNLASSLGDPTLGRMAELAESRGL